MFAITISTWPSAFTLRTIPCSLINAILLIPVSILPIPGPCMSITPRQDWSDIYILVFGDLKKCRKFPGSCAKPPCIVYKILEHPAGRGMILNFPKLPHTKTLPSALTYELWADR